VEIHEFWIFITCEIPRSWKSIQLRADRHWPQVGPSQPLLTLLSTYGTACTVRVQSLAIAASPLQTIATPFFPVPPSVHGLALDFTHETIDTIGQHDIEYDRTLVTLLAKVKLQSLATVRLTTTTPFPTQIVSFYDDPSSRLSFAGDHRFDA
jgi:hypothetical protein